VTVTVSALPISIINLEVKTCPGTAYEYQGASLAVGETRSFILKNWQNCDSIVNVKVTALPVSASAFSVQICPGTTYTYGSVDIPVGAIQDFTLKNWLGCDSIVTVTVSALPISIINLEVKTCPGTTYEYQGASLTVGETRSFFLKNWQNCDSIVNVKIIALPVSASALQVKTCPGTTYAYGSANLPVGAVQDFTLKNWLGCDSIVTVTVSALPTSTGKVTGKACPGGTFEYAGEQLAVGVVRDFKLQNWLGCDSIVTVTVSALPVSAGSVAGKACPGGTFQYAGEQLAVGLVKDFTFQNSLGCDSIVTVTVSALPVSTGSAAGKACPGSTFEYAGEQLAVGAIKDFMLKNWLGCDSVVTVTVSALPVSKSSVAGKACPGSTFEYAGEQLAVGAVKDFTRKNWLGCDSVVTVTVSALPVSTGNLTGKACPGGTFEYAGEQLAVGAIKDFTLQNWLGCDSVVTVSVSEYPSVAFSILAKASCPNTATGELTVSPLGGITEISISLNATDFQDNLTFQHLSEGAYTLTVKDQNGCTAQQEAVLDLLPTAAFTLPDALLPCGAPSITLSPVWENKPIGLQYQWHNGAPVEAIQVAEAGLVWLEVSDQCQTVRQEAQVRWEGEQEGDLVYVPNVFSPDAQEPLNSVFKTFIATDVEVLRFRLQVFDR